MKGSLSILEKQTDDDSREMAIAGLTRTIKRKVTYRGVPEELRNQIHQLPEAGRGHAKHGGIRVA